jgi:hypothetical protein
MIRHGTPSPFITGPGEEEHSSPNARQSFVPVCGLSEAFQGATGRCPPDKIKVGCRFAAHGGSGQTVAAIYGSLPPLPTPDQSAK